MLRNVLIGCICCLSVAVNAVQPMGESDLQDVSANTGNNVLSIFGASASGIDAEAADIELNKEQHQESDEVLSEVNADLLEDDQQPGQENEVNTPALNESLTRQVLSANETSVRTGATSGLTNSETRFKTDNFKHESTFINTDNVQMDRDLFIDRLAIEDMAGDALGENRSAGSITISNWRSQGQTIISSE